MSHAVLIIEDEATLARNIKQYLDRHGFEVRIVASAEDGLKQLDEYKPDVILLDFHLPGMNGLEALAQIHSRDSKVKLIMITGDGSVEKAVDAMKSGAHDYLRKPIVLGELKLRLEKVLSQDRMEQALSYYQQEAAKQGGLARMIGESPPIRELRANLRQLLEAEQHLEDGTPPAVLITGETGTGKELVARALHFDGKRRARPFIEINCASIPTQLLEAELFGYERGAFTDARGRKLGLAETADGGTLFLDEIGDVEPVLQGKLLKLLEEKVVRRLGSLRDVKVDVRVVAATNRPLEQWVKEGRFRSDLYFRLRGVQLVLPPLRSRGEDILSLARDFLALHSARYGKKQLRFSEPAEKALLSYVWPGNVRELRNVIEETVLLANTDVIHAEQLSMCAMLGAPLSAPAEVAAREIGPEVPGEDLKLAQMERTMLVQALEKTDGNVTRAAKLLGLSRDTLRYRIEKYNLRID